MTTETVSANTPGEKAWWKPGSLALRAKHSFAFRSGPLYRRMLTLLPSPSVAAKRAFEVPLITMCGGKHLPMLVQMLYSIALYWRQIPEVTVVNDGSLDSAEIKRRLAWWPGGLHVTHWTDDQDYHRQQGRAALAEYAEKEAFGRKLSTVLAWSEKRRTFWCDCDVLFYDDFTSLITSPAESKPFILGTQDWVYAYDERLLKMGLTYLLDRPPVNAGICLFEGNLYEECKLEPLIEVAAVEGNWFTEQTIMAHAVYKVGRLAWTLDVIRSFNEDMHTVLPTYLRQAWIVRHYTNNIRHLFWRDALALRLGIGRPAPTLSA